MGVLCFGWIGIAVTTVVVVGLFLVDFDMIAVVNSVVISS